MSPPSSALSSPTPEISNESGSSHDAFSILRRAGSIAGSLEDQRAGLNSDDIKAAKSIEDLPKLRLTFRQKAHDYVLEEWLHRKRGRSSWIQGHGTQLIRVLPDGQQIDVFVCGHCDSAGITRLFEGDATSAAGRHLKSHHRIFPDGEDSEESPSPAKRQATLDFSKSRAKPSKPPILRTAADTFKHLLLGWIVDADIPFYGIEHPLFRQLLLLLNKDFINQCLPQSSNT
ncbi:hypothetical protein B0J13DRAFT_457396, partial [Dactylonectria estremocensis]